jgi:hypothetical protein
VVFLTSAPPGLSLTSELRAELRRAVGEVSDEASEDGETLSAIPQARRIDLHALLGTDQTATLDEIEAAYRKRLREVRAQRMPSRDTELQKLVEEQVKAINAAYETFLEKRRPDETNGAEKNVGRVWERFSKPGN